MERRLLLKNVLLKQNEQALLSYPKIKENIEALADENSLTITTGHQLSLAGGPLFLWYKLCTVISQARYCSEQWNRKVLPVFWMATEDHDLQELNDFSFFAKRIEFEPGVHTSAGRLKPEHYQHWIETFENLTGPNKAENLWNAFTSGRNLAEATRNWVNAAFGDDGLLVLDADEPRLKELFLPLALRELQEGFSEKAVNHTTQYLQQEGLVKDLPVSPRNLNLFWFDGDERKRLVRHEDGSISAGKEAASEPVEMWVERFKNHPADVSPNVIMRPIYQELILPNIAYIGGPGECAYWLQLRDAFQLAEVPYPVLLPRMNVLWISEKFMSFWEKEGLVMDDFKLHPDALKKKISESALPEYLNGKAAQELEAFYQSLEKIFSSMEPTLGASVLSEKQKALNGLQQVTGKLQKAIRQKEEQKINKLMKVLDTVYPEGKAQERAAHLFQFSWLIQPEMKEQLFSLAKTPGLNVFVGVYQG